MRQVHTHTHTQSKKRRFIRSSLVVYSLFRIKLQPAFLPFVLLCSIRLPLSMRVSVTKTRRSLVRSPLLSLTMSFTHTHRLQHTTHTQFYRLWMQSYTLFHIRLADCLHKRRVVCSFSHSYGLQSLLSLSLSLLSQNTAIRSTHKDTRAMCVCYSFCCLLTLFLSFSLCD